MAAERGLRLKTGHDYGPLCMLQDFSTAECVLSEVWSNRKKVLGETDPAAIDTGLPLSQVYFWEEKSKAAFAMSGSMHDLHTTLSNDLHCARKIERAELLALFHLPESTDMNNSRHAIFTLEKTVEARTQVYGMGTETYKSALCVAELSASCGNFAKSDEISTWVFKNVTNNAQQQDNLDSDNGSRTIAIRSGVTSSAMKFLLQKRREGNRVLNHVVDHAASGRGRESSSYQRLAYLQAYLLFMQRDSRRSMTILRKIYNEHVEYKGPQHRETKIASYFLGLGLIVDSVLSGDDIPREVEVFNISDERRSLLAMTCSIMAMILVKQHLASLAVPLLHWIYRDQKRRHGRLSRGSLTALAIMNVVKVWKAGRLTQISSNEGTPKDPRIFMQHFWEKALRSSTKRITIRRGNSVPLSTTILSESLMRAKAKESFQRDMGICFLEREKPVSAVIYPFLPGYRILSVLEGSTRPASFEEVPMSRFTTRRTTVEDVLNRQTKYNRPAVETIYSDSSQSTPNGSTKNLNHQTNFNAPAVGTIDSDSSQSTPNGSTKNLNGLTGLFDQAIQEHLRVKGAKDGIISKYLPDCK